MLFRAWTVTRNLNVFRIVRADLTGIWLEVVMEIHLNSEGDLYFGARCSSLAELALGARGTEADLQELIRRDLLIWLDEGGVALPEDLGLRPPERVGGKTAMGMGATPPQRRNGREPDRRQGEILMAVASSETKSESANVESPLSQTQPNGAENPAFDLSRAPSLTQVSPLAGGESKNTTTTTKELESFLSGGGGPLGAAREPESANVESQSESANAESHAESADVESANPESPHAALTQELLRLVGRTGDPEPRELEEVRTWLLARTANEIREAIGTRMERPNAPRAPHLTYFSKRVLGWATPVRYEPPPAPPRPPEPPEDSAATVTWLRDDPDNSVLMTAWTPLRASLRAEIGDAEYRAYVRDMKLGGLDGDEIVLLLPSDWARDFVREKLGPRITTLWRAGYPEARRVDFRTRPA